MSGDNLRIRMDLDGDTVEINISGLSLANARLPEKLVAGDIEHMVAYAYKRLISERRKEARELTRKKILLEGFISSKRLQDEFHRYLNFIGQEYNAA